MQQPCGLIHHYSFSPVTFNSVNRAGEVHRGEMTGIRPAARGGGEQGRARNFTWSDLGWNPQLCHLPAVDGNLGNLLTNLRLCIIVWNARTPPPTLESNWHVITVYQPRQINTKASSPHHNPTRQILLRSLFYTKGNRSSERRCPRDLVCDKSRSGAFNPASRSLSYAAGPAPQPGRTREPDKAHFCLIHLLAFHFLHSAWQGHSNGFKNNHKKPLIWSSPTPSSWKNTCSPPMRFLIKHSMAEKRF